MLDQETKKVLAEPGLAHETQRVLPEQTQETKKVSPKILRSTQKAKHFHPELAQKI